jgi:IS30 family transposase
LITERPSEADDRLTAGHWEGDLVIGQIKSSQAIGVLYERTSRHIRLLKLERHDAGQLTGDSGGFYAPCRRLSAEL